jgi:S-DNA-T family DNA segregation ATPase FtsK/SpoIIIE
MKNNKKNGKEKIVKHSLNPETKNGIIAIIVFALAGISLLSYFNLAGKVGQMISLYSRITLGWSYPVFPLILIFVGYFLLSPKSSRLKAVSYIGLLLFLLSLNGLLNLAVTGNNAIELIKQGEGGGYLGIFLSLPFQNIMGFWATLIVLAALTIISLLLIFNTTLSKLARSGLFIFWPIKAIINIPSGVKNIFHREKTSPNEAIEEEPKIEETSPQFSAKPVTLAQESNGQMKISVAPSDKKNAESTARIHRKVDLPIDLLNPKSEKPTSGDIQNNMEVIKRTLENFNIPVEMGEVSIGPTVTQYTLKPAEGIKLASITSLQNDLAMALAAHPIRIEAPIPGKSLVGIEVPNQKVAIVQLRETIESDEFKKRKSNLMIALGKDVSGKPWLADLARMPHLLVAGATGSGKSVCLNSIIVSLLYENGPDDLKFIMVDPKRVELQVYNNIPHLLTPVITDVKKTVNALRWAIGEMERRYEVLEKNQKRNIASYNATTKDTLPYIVFVIDEMADLMISAAAEVEGAIIRLAQMARAVGIHLVLATQRPSVDIITGLIKANITSRIAFSVASAVDSRTILDTSGAEKLLGRGDMLYISAELSKPKRLQGAYLADNDIHKVVEFLKQNNDKPEYQEEIVAKQHTIGGRMEFSEGDGDELFDEAKETVIQAGKASASLLQRRLKVGYARAARLLDLLEEQGMIGPADGARPRDVLINDAYSGNMGEPENNPESSLVESEDIPPEEIKEE